jgi:hypothetical protein
MWLKRVFLAESADKRDAFSMAVKYYVVASAEIAKNNFTFNLAKNPTQSLPTYQADIEGLYDHLEASLTQKKLSKLINITNDIDLHVKKTGKSMKDIVKFNEENPTKIRLTLDLEEM